jgi:hypothetical protein
MNAITIIGTLILVIVVCDVLLSTFAPSKEN